MMKPKPSVLGLTRSQATFAGLALLVLGAFYLLNSLRPRPVALPSDGANDAAGQQQPHPFTVSLRSSLQSSPVANVLLRLADTLKIAFASGDPSPSFFF